MRKMIFVFLSLFLFGNVFAQMDEKFYHPDREWIPVDIPNYSEMMLIVQQDTIYSAWIRPEQPAKATILYFHGNGGNISKWMKHVKPMIDAGFQVFMPDYRGYGKSTGKPTHVNIAHDARAFFDTLMRQPGVSDLPLIVYGASLGTQVAVHLTRHNNKKISALVLDGMMASFTDIALATSPVEHHPYIRQLVTSPYSAIEDIGHVAHVNLLVIHSEEDAVPISGARSVYEKAVCPKDFWLYEGKHLEAGVLYPDRMIARLNRLVKQE
ncbi:MAG: alpha/beta hydrolase [Tannerellaceae bacterium]|nr:alpha/beta hydrolase [Tannerellaceae bacterium]